MSWHIIDSIFSTPLCPHPCADPFTLPISLSSLCYKTKYVFSMPQRFCSSWLFLFTYLFRMKVNWGDLHRLVRSFGYWQAINSGILYSASISQYLEWSVCSKETLLYHLKYISHILHCFRNPNLPCGKFLLLYLLLHFLNFYFYLNRKNF